MTGAKPLVIAFLYDSISLYQSRGYSLEDCVELDSDETIDAIERSIQKNGYQVARIGDVKELVQRMAKGEHEQWDLAFSISEGMHGVSREAQIPGLLEAYKIPHAFSDAATLAMCLDKGKTKMILEHLGIATAPFIILPASWTQAEYSIPTLLQNASHGNDLNNFPLFIKPACEGSSKGIYHFSKVMNHDELEDGLQNLKNRFPGQSILIERFLSGREYTISILGTGRSSRVIGTALMDWEGLDQQKQALTLNDGSVSTNQKNFYDYYNKNVQGNDDPICIVNDRSDPEVKAAEELALRAWRALGCCDIGRVDIRYEDGRPYVIELNPLPGMSPSGSWLPETARHYGISHGMLLGKVLDSAIERYPHLRARCSPSMRSELDNIPHSHSL